MKFSSVSCLLFSSAFAKAVSLDREDADFVAYLNTANINAQPTDPCDDVGNEGVTYFWLNSEEESLFYEIVLPTLVIDDDVTGGNPKSVTKIHFHFAAAPSKGPHALNVFRLPCEDDDDVALFPSEGAITGFWDETDVPTCAFGTPGQSQPIAIMLPLLCQDEIYVNVHTNRCTAGEVRGNFEIISDKAEDFCDDLLSSISSSSSSE